MIGVAIIGTGSIALAKHMPGLALCPQAQVVALCDENDETLERAAQQTGVKWTYHDYHLLLKRDDVDAVIIATPNFTHPPIVQAAVAAKKHVLCEKPLALDYATALQMYRAA